MSLFGVDVLVSSSLTDDIRRVQYRFPRSRKKRIRKKWAKNPSNWRDEVVGSPYLHLDNRVFTTPEG